MRFFGKGKGLAGAGYVVLNGQRVLNIITLITVAGASGVLIAKTFELDGFGFFAALGHIMRIVFALFLIASEVAFQSYFAKNWPLFAPKHGFVMLGFAFLFFGINIFGELSHRETSQERLGMSFWQLTLAAGILSIIMAVFNLIFSYVFRDTSHNISARHIRAHGAAATNHKADIESVQSPSPNRFTRCRSFFLGKKNSEKRTSLPSYESTPRRGMNISSPISPASSKYSQYPPGPLSPEAAKHPAERHGNMI